VNGEYESLHGKYVHPYKRAKVQINPCTGLWGWITIRRKSSASPSTCITSIITRRILECIVVWCQFSMHAMRDFQPINPRHRVVSILMTTSLLGTTCQGMEYLTNYLEIVSFVEANR
jgi:hypothetical protein